MPGKHGFSTAGTSDAAIGSALPAIMAGLTAATDSTGLATGRSNVPTERLDDTRLSKLEALAHSPLPDLPPCDAAHFAKSMRALAILPSRADDDVKGELRLAIYQRLFGQYPREAISFLVEQALVTLEWFPSPKQCRDILQGWTRRDAPVRDREVAAALVRRERQARFDDTMEALARRALDQAAIDALPSAIRKVAAERGYLRLHDDGVYRVRPLTEGAQA